MQDYIIRKDGDEWLAVSPDGSENGPFESHEDALEQIAQECIESGDECRLLFDDGSGELEEIPNWSPERFIDAGSSDNEDRGRRSVRRRRQNVRKSDSGRSRSRRRRSAPRGGSFDFRSYMNSAQQVRENLGQLFFAREPDEI
jgi:hypothetical protein